MTWQIISAKSRGYSVTVNSTCAACTQLCDVAVAIGLPPTISKVMFNAYDIYMKYDPIDDKKFLDYDTWMFNAEVAHKVLPFNQFHSAFVNLSSRPEVSTSRGLLYGSWHDANTYCAERNSTLLTLQPSQSTYFLHLLPAIDHGWKNSHKHYFVGLYRTGSVSRK